MTEPTCDCQTRPCGVVKSARAFLGAWARERRRQMGDDAANIGRAIPDRDAMASALPDTIGACDCPCHERAVEERRRRASHRAWAEQAVARIQARTGGTSK